MSLIAELKRRNVIRVGIAYGVGAWLLMQVADILFEAFAAPDWALRGLVLVLLIGLPLALLLAWVFEWTPQGLKRESELAADSSLPRDSGRRLDRLIIVILAVALGYFAIDKFVLRPGFGEGPREWVAEGEGAPPTPPAVELAKPAFALPDDASVAVLPLEDLSRSADSAAFAAGIHADLLTQLAGIGNLRVISKTSVDRFAGSDRSVFEIAGLLNAATVLEGGVQRAGNQVRISLQLIDAATDSTLWAEAFDKRLTVDNVFTIQREIAVAVATALDATLTDGPTASAPSAPPTEDLVALEAYFEGRKLMDRRTAASLEAARERFAAARERDPNFALALTGEAQAILLLSDDGGNYGTIPLSESVAMAMPLLERSLVLAPNEPQTLAVYGNALVDARRVEEGIEYLQRSLELNPSSGEVLNWYALSLARAGRFRESLEINERMVKVDAANELTLYNAAVSLADWDGVDDEFVDDLLNRLERLSPARAAMAQAAIAQSRGRVVDSVVDRYRALNLDWERVTNRRALSSTLLALGLIDEAKRVDDWDFDRRLASTTGDWPRLLQLVREDFKERPAEPGIAGGLAIALYVNGRYEDALALALQLWEATGRDPWWFGTTNLLNTSLGMLELGNEERADEFLQQGRQALLQELSAGRDSAELQLNQALLAMLEQRDTDAIAHLERAIDLGERWLKGFELPAWNGLRDSPDFQAQMRRLEQIIADEQRQVRDLLCGLEPLVAPEDLAGGTCTPLESG